MKKTTKTIEDTQTHGVTRPKKLVIKGGTIVDQKGIRSADLLVHDGLVVEIGENLSVPIGATILDADSCLVGPGLVDLHTHLRQPGREEAETVESGSRAGALGGYTAVVAMPNTEPAIDSASTAKYILELGRSALCEVAVAGAITLGRKGIALAPMAELAGLGVTIFTDDGTGVQDGSLMRNALEYSKGLGVLLAQHAEDEKIAAGGSMHEGEWSSRLGIAGIASAAEEAMIARDIILARASDTPIHFLHISTAGSVDLVRQAKKDGLKVTAEAAPHHFYFTDAEVQEFDPDFKVNPPLRGTGDVDAIRDALIDGTIDAIATDHAPHAAQTKDEPFDKASFGMLGLETSLAVTFSVFGDLIGPERIFSLCSWQPAAIARLKASDERIARHSPQGGPIVQGSVANLCIFDPSVRWVVDPLELAGPSRNSPYKGRTLRGKVRHTVFRGEPVVIDSKAMR